MNEDQLPHGGELKDVKRLIDKLTGVVGNLDDKVSEMVTAFKGNELGTEGIVPQMKKVMEEQKALRIRLDALELETSKKQFYLIAFFAALGVVLGTLIDRLFKK